MTISIYCLPTPADQGLSSPSPPQVCTGPEPGFQPRLFSHRSHGFRGSLAPGATAPPLHRAEKKLEILIGPCGLSQSRTHSKAWPPFQKTGTRVKRGCVWLPRVPCFLQQPVSERAWCVLGAHLPGRRRQAITWLLMEGLKGEVAAEEEVVGIWQKLTAALSWDITSPLLGEPRGPCILQHRLPIGFVKV